MSFVVLAKKRSLLIKNQMKELLKKAIFHIFLAVLAVAAFQACPSTSGSWETIIAADGTVISARGALGRLETAPSGPMYSGDGGRNIRLAILAPQAQGETPGYLPLYIQGLLNNNFGKFSAINLIDRQNLDRIIAEQNLAANGRYSDNDFVRIGNLTNAQYFLFGTIQKLSGDRYSLQLSVTDSSTGIRRANFMRDCTFAQLEGRGALINEATAELLAQLGVQLTETGLQTLLAGNTSTARAEAGLARGITAQAGGSEIEALFNYTQAITFDPSRIETLSRLNVLSSAISGGTISQRIVNDIQARDSWLEAFKETARFFNDHPPFEIIFDPNLIQIGQTDYARRTANIGMRIALDPSQAGFGALNALLEGLEKTGRRREWGFSGWPLIDITPRTAGTVVFGGRRSFSYRVDVALVNERNKTLGNSSITLTTESIIFSAGDNIVTPPFRVYDVVSFRNIKAEDLTPTLTIVIRAVNGISSRNLNASGYMKIETGDLVQSPVNFVRINGGTFTMGSPSNEPGRGSNETQRQVTVSSFYMSRYEVTQKEYQEVMGTNPSNFKGDNLPVERVSWFDAVEYCNARSRKEGLTPAYTIDKSRSDPNNTSEYDEYDDVRWVVTWNRNANGYRLPTEAEWEYACRAGTTTAYNTGKSENNNTGWYAANSARSTQEVGRKLANAWGLYDMHGNVWEWCWDWYGNYASGAQTDPVGASSGSYRVNRGGSWQHSGQYARSASRAICRPSGWGVSLGFRLVRPWFW
jgi:formylglycine-generating enzyme required for sulfatase activity